MENETQVYQTQVDQTQVDQTQVDQTQANQQQVDQQEDMRSPAQIKLDELVLTVEAMQSRLAALEGAPQTGIAISDSVNSRIDRYLRAGNALGAFRSFIGALRG